MSSVKRWGVLGLLASTALTAVQMAHAQDESDEPAPYIMAAAIHDRIIIIGSAEDARKTAGAAQYISEIELEKFEYQDVNRILRLVPGVNLQEEDGFGLRPNIGLRGTGLDRSSKVAILEDGVLAAPAPYAAPSAYYFPIAGRMQAVEVVKGASAIKYGPLTTGGAVNMFSTSIPEQTTARLTTRFGTDEYFMANGVLGSTFETGSMEVGAMIENYHAQSDGFKELDEEGSTGFDIDDVVAKVSFASTSGSDRPQSSSSRSNTLTRFQMRLISA